MKTTTLTTDQLIEQLLATDDPDDQRAVLARRDPELDEEFAARLKRDADQALRSDLSQSETIADLILSFAEIAELPKTRALGLLAKANALSIGRGAFSESIEVYNEASRIYSELGEHVSVARSQIGKIGAFAHLGEFEECHNTYTGAAQVLESNEQWVDLATLQMNYGIALARAGNDFDALYWFDESRRSFELAGVEGSTRLNWVALNRAYVLRNLGKFKEALEACKLAQAGLREAGQFMAEARAIQMEALTLSVMGDYTEAMRRLLHVRDLYSGDGRTRDAALIDLYMSDCYLFLRRYQDALECARRVRDDARIRETNPLRARSALNIGISLMKLGNSVESEEAFIEARDLYQELGNSAAAARVLLEQSELQVSFGDYSAALGRLDQISKTLEKLGRPTDQARAQLVRSLCLLHLGKLEEAHDAIGLTMRLARDLGLPSLLSSAYELQGKLEMTRGEGYEALESMLLAIRHLETARGRVMVEYTMDFLSEKTGLYESAFELAVNLGEYDKAQTVTDSYRSRALLDIVQGRVDLSIKRRNKTDLSLIETIEKLTLRRNALIRNWEAELSVWDSERDGDTSAERELARKHILELENKTSSLWEELLVRNTAYSGEANLWVPSDRLPSATRTRSDLTLEYFRCSDRLYAIISSRDERSVISLGAIAKPVQALMRQLGLNFALAADHNRGAHAVLVCQALANLKKLYELLYRPIADQVESADHIVIIPIGSLHNLPFHALHTGDEYLIQRVSISYLPTSALFSESDSFRVVRTTCAIFSNSNGGQLRFADHEAEMIAQIVGAAHHKEEKATRSAAAAALSTKEIVHFASHGTYRPDQPLFSSIELHDGAITVLDILRTSVNSQIVILSACETGLGRVKPGDEVIGLARAFLAKGVRGLVMSNWPVDDEYTSQIMIEMYKGLVDGKTVCRALREAQISALSRPFREMPIGVVHPYFWAAFRYLGDARIGLRLGTTRKRMMTQ